MIGEWMNGEGGWVRGCFRSYSFEGYFGNYSFQRVKFFFYRVEKVFF